MKALLWGDGTNVDFDRGIAYCLSEIRSALHDSGANPRFVQTLPKQGFRMLVPVEVAKKTYRREFLGVGLGGLMASGAWVFWPRKPKVGVSIFDNETGKKELDRWVAGLSDVVVAKLSTLAIGVVGNEAALRRSRNIRQLKGLAAELKVDFLVLGQLQLHEAGLRFVTHLIRLADGVHLKAKRIVWDRMEVAGLEPLVVAEFETAVKQHVLHEPKP